MTHGFLFAADLERSCKLPAQKTLFFLGFYSFFLVRVGQRCILPSWIVVVHGKTTYCTKACSMVLMASLPTVSPPKPGTRPAPQPAPSPNPYPRPVIGSIGGYVESNPWQAPEGSFARQNSMLWRNQPDGAIPRDLEVIVGERRGRVHPKYAMCCTRIQACRRLITMALDLNFSFILLSKSSFTVRSTSVTHTASIYLMFAQFVVPRRSNITS